MWISLDGFISETEVTDWDWVLGGDEMSDYEIGMVRDADTLLLGRKTFEGFADHWGKVPENPEAPTWEKTYAAKINALEKIVFSRTLRNADWNNSEIFKEIVFEQIEKLKTESKKGIIIYGSASIVRELARLELIDEFQFLVHPVMLGGGTTLFKERVNLKLTESRQFESGVTLLKLEPDKNYGKRKLFSEK